ncbi:OmpA family protein [Ferruginibacter yonginensis]|uniref:OmpA family protein n=1 Tax=Ferruginibacter yonginensis TaxID=1310416 RepID=A0ABV8QTN1_9BACT
MCVIYFSISNKAAIFAASNKTTDIMKKSMLLVLATIVSAISFAQTNNKKLPSLAAHFSLIDYKGAANVRTKSLETVINQSQLFKIKEMNAALSLSYLQGFTDKIDFAATITGAVLKHPTSATVKNISGEDKVLVEAAATANFKLLSDASRFTPFLTLGVGATSWSSYFSAFTPVGAGVQLKINPGVFVLVNSQYRIPITENGAYHFYHSIGIASNITDAKAPKVVELPVAAPVVLDRDGDGVLDADDKCPDVAGLAALNGCPDRDGDGIADGDDKCPTVAGLAKYQGCPIPDTDGDGINDEQDKCPTVKGLARYQGCPIPDTDGDGVNDEEDKCPTRKGPASNQGCPEIAKEVVEKINYAAKNVFFSTGSFKLLPKSFKSLDEVVTLLKADVSLLIDVDGHTDAQGADDKNQTLSENRAAAVKNYLVSKGIAESRLKATGYGETKPVADNKTAAGRAKNRRTEMTVRNF